MSVSEVVGDRIRRLRRERGLTQAALGGGRFSESYISLIESGRREATPEVLAHLAEALGCSVGALLGVEQAPDAAEAEMLIRRGEWETSSGRPESAIAHLTRGVTLAEQLNLPALATRGKAGLAKALEIAGRLTDAVAVWEGLVADAAGDPRNGWWAAATVGLSRCCREIGDLDRAIQVGEQFWQSAGHSGGAAKEGLEEVVVAGATLLTAYLELGDQNRSRELAAELVDLAEYTGTPMATGAAYWNAALAAQADGRMADALRLAEKAQASLAQTEDVRNKARLQTALAGLHLRVRPPAIEDAIRLLQDAEPVLAQFGNAVDVSYCRTELARAYLQLLDYERAREIAATTIAELDSAGESRIESSRTLMVLSAAESGLGNKTAAHEAIHRAADLLEQAGANRQAASSWTELAELCVSLGQSDQAIEAFRKANELLGAKRTAGTTNPAEAVEAKEEAEAS